MKSGPSRAQRRADSARQKARVRRRVVKIWRQPLHAATPAKVGKLASHHHTCGLCCGARHSPHAKGASRLTRQERRALSEPVRRG